MIKSKSLIAFTLISVSSIISAQTVKPGGNSKPITDNKTNLNYEYALNDPLNTRIYTLKNGMKVYLSVYKNAPRIQTLIAVKAGSKNDPANATGLAHYLEHMVFKGTDVYGTKDFKKESVEIKKIENLYEVYRGTKDEAQRKKIYHQIDSISGVAAKYAIANEYDKMLAGIGATGTNAFTSFDQTVYVNDIPSNQIDNWLKIEAERFRKPVLRLFHTELEAVYEEKNRGLDSDENKVYEAIMEGLFKNHTYGTQTTIGTIEHLKNPSMVEINKFYNKYYVPNNMAIIMSGDFDPDKVIVDIEKNFGKFAPKPYDEYKFQPETTISQKLVKEVIGPDPMNVNLGWRVGGEGTKDAEIGAIIAYMMYNGTAGLLDLNLNQAQKVLNSNGIFYALKDYSLFGLTGMPKEGQTLEEVEKLILEQLDIIKKGNFPDWLLQAVITDVKYDKTKSLEDNQSRSFEMLGAFINDIKWQNKVNSLERMSKITKQEIVDFANKNFTETNYVVVYKRIGEDKSVQKVEKPAITPVELDRDNSSPFVKNIVKSTPATIEPKFLDYDKDILKSTIKSNIPLLYTKNTENNLFQMYYKFDMGSNNDKLLPIAIKYIKYVAGEDITAEQFKQELYKLGSSFDVFIDNENTWVSLDGLSDNYDKTVQLFEKVLAKPLVDEKVLKNLIEDFKKERNDNKLQKRLILNRAMVSYARYGAINPFSFVMTDEELDKVTVADVKSKIKSLLTFEHKILYYGPKEADYVKTVLNTNHNVPEKLSPIPVTYNFVEKQFDKTVYVVDYDMKQAEIMMLGNGNSFDANQVPIISLYNHYFGGNMSGVVFQDLRESKALAYSCYSRYNQPNKLSKNYFNASYIGSQADKLADAIKGMNDLLNELPKADASFNAAKESLIAETRTQRITKADILFNYLSAQDLGLNYDNRKTVFEKASTLTFDDVKNFHQQNIKGKSNTILVLGKKDRLDMKVLEKYGTVKFLTLKEVFGY
jgi:predicted Zn-dependent peptidase